MKKLILILLVLLFIGTAPAMADLLIVSSDSDVTNPGTVKPNNPAAEQGWLEAILGSQDVQFIDKLENVNSTESSSGYTMETVYPEFDWMYAVVKIGNGNGVRSHYAFSDDNGDGMLTAEYTFDHAVSHVSFFDGSPASSVPEPATMLLLGAGLVGLAGFGRRKFTR